MKKFTVACVAFAAVSAFAGTAAAEGLELGARLGYGIPMGDAVKDGKLSDGIKSQIPIWIDAGYRIDESLFAGLYMSYGIAQLKEDCPDGASCSATDIRVGLQGQYHLSPAESMDPWLGLGIGYEMAKLKVEAGGAEASTTYSGFEFLNLQGGLDFEAAEGVGVGPFLSFSLGQYSKAKVETPAGSVDGDIEDKAMHQWLTLGVRGTFQL
jgi:outer membrane protein W